MAAKKETYSQAMERLEKIVRQIDNNELEMCIRDSYQDDTTSRIIQHRAGHPQGVVDVR